MKRSLRNLYSELGRLWPCGWCTKLTVRDLSPYIPLYSQRCRGGRFDDDLRTDALEGTTVRQVGGRCMMSESKIQQAGAVNGAIAKELMNAVV